MAGYEKININVANIFNKYGSTSLNALMDYVTGADNVQLYGSEFAVDINTKTTIRSGKLFLKDSDNSHTSQFLFEDQSSDQIVAVPAISTTVAGVGKKDSVALLKQGQAFEAKSIDLTKNTVFDPDAGITHLATFDSQGHLTKILTADVVGTLALPNASETIKGIVELSKADGTESAGGRVVQDNDPRLGAGTGGPHTHDWADVTGEPLTWPPSAHNHAGSEINSGTIPAAQLPAATTSVKGAVILATDNESTAGEAVQSNDTRMSNARTPVAHVHAGADVSSGTVPAAQLPLATTSVRGAVILSSDNEATAGEAVQANDTRMSNARTPVAHNHLWADTTDKPTTFTPTAHVHAGADISSGTVPAAQLPNASTTVKGAVILATDNESTAGEAVQSNDTRMSNARAPTAHTHLWAAITDPPATYAPSSHAYSSHTGIPSTFAPSAHTHLWAETTDKPTTFTPSAHTHLWADTTDKPTTFTPTAHNHAATDINSGELAVTRGGTGKNSITQHALLKGGATNTYTEIAASTDGKVLKMVAGTPAWADEAGGAHTHTIAAIDDAGANEGYVIKIVAGVPAWAPDATGEGSGIQNISEADDVTLTSLADGQILEYDTGTTDWINVNHDHSALFAALAHDHDADYSAIGHNHDAAYSAIAHDHAGVYSPVAHNHTGVYAPNSHTHDWADITGEPLTYAPSAHASSHANGGADEIAIDWSQITTSVPTAFTPSTHTHVWAAITDPPATYAPSSHTYASHTSIPSTFAPSAHASGHANGGGDEIAIDWSQITTGIPSTFTPSTHTHLWADTTDKPTTFAPTTHASAHKSGGGDAIKLDELAAPTDITTLNASTTLHGLMPKLATTPYQVYRINSGGTAGEWASLDSMKVGKSTANGGGTSFTIAHGLGATPTYAFVTMYGPDIMAIKYTWDGTNITVTTASNTTSGTANVLFVWWVIA